MGSRGTISGLDARTVCDNIEMIESHLISRRATDDTINAIHKIASLNNERVSMIKERDLSLQERKIQSEIVGKLMRSKNNDNDNDKINEAKEKSNKAAKNA